MSKYRVGIPFCGTFTTKLEYASATDAAEAFRCALEQDYPEDGTPRIVNLLDVNGCDGWLISARFMKHPAGRLAPEKLNFIVLDDCVYETTLSLPSRGGGAFEFVAIEGPATPV